MRWLLRLSLCFLLVGAAPLPEPPLDYAAQLDALDRVAPWRPLLKPVQVEELDFERPGCLQPGWLDEWRCA